MGGSVSPHLLYLLPCVFKLDNISHLSSLTNQYYTSKSFPTCPSPPSKGTFHQTLELTLHNQPAPLYPSLLRSSPHLAFTSTESLSPKLPCLPFLPIPVQSGCSSSQHTSLKLFLQIVCTFWPPECFSPQTHGGSQFSGQYLLNYPIFYYSHYIKPHS